AGWLDGGEAERAIRQRGELAAQVHLRLRGVLVLVEADGGGVPHVDFGAGERLALRVLDPALEDQLRSWCRRAQQRRAVLAFGRAGTEERPEVVRLRGMPVVQQADEIGDTEGAGEQHRLVVTR